MPKCMKCMEEYKQENFVHTVAEGEMQTLFISIRFRKRLFSTVVLL